MANLNNPKYREDKQLSQLTRQSEKDNNLLKSRIDNMNLQMEFVATSKTFARWKKKRERIVKRKQSLARVKKFFSFKKAKKQKVTENKE